MIIAIVQSIVSAVCGGGVRALLHFIDYKITSSNNAKDIAMDANLIEKMKIEKYDPKTIADEQVRLNDSKAQLLNAISDSENPLSTWQRPILFFTAITWYNASKVLLVIGYWKDKITYEALQVGIFTQFDMNMLSGLVGYTIADRSLSKPRQS